MFSWLFGNFSRRCLTADEFNSAIDHLHYQLYHLKRSFMASAQDIRDALAKEKDAVAQNTLRVNHAIQVLKDLAQQIADLKAGGGATQAELDGLLATVTDNTAAISASDDALAAADPPAPAPVSGGASVGSAGSSSGDGTVT